MDIPQEINDYIKESIEFSVGLRVSEKTLELKLQASEEARIRIQDEYYYLQNRLKEKDDLIERARSEASMNAQALKKFVEENQKLAVECGNLLSQCARWEKECSLYDRDREALMEFANEADEKAKDTEIRVIEAEDELRRLREELHCYKQEREMHMITETRATKELQLLREKINEIQCSRSLGCDDNQNGEPHKCPSTPVSAKLNLFIWYIICTKEVLGN
ncbi:hypothetical protein GIB67_006287 [Kingdonia uniflora]|uniref:Uncharacterized protein n=1 Tax=Kingdonia uniflora TaxID=39325 RepID=A0A7J7P5B1_9MAGN|nr:hypothetical protein GIB67_006287 [Kingdonia uniflora]